MSSLVLYCVITTALYYLGYYAAITRCFWSRYPTWLKHLMGCPACIGFWWGIGCGALGWWLQLPFLGLPARHPVTVAAVGLGALVWTPPAAWLHLQALSWIDWMREELDKKRPDHATTTEVE